MVRPVDIPVVSREVPPELQKRLRGLLGMALVALGLLVLRLCYLQIFEGERFRSLSENNRVRIKRVIATRGQVLDRSGEVLVDNRPAFDIVVVPEDARDPAQVVERLGGYLGADPGRLGLLVGAAGRPPFEPVVVERDIGWPQVVAVEAHQLDLPGVSLDVGYLRTYVHGAAAAHLLGHVGEIGPEQLRRGNGYRMGDVVGKAGVERFWEENLRGAHGGRQIEVDALGRQLRVLSEVSAEPGDNVVLSLDLKLQAAAEQALGPREGAVVVLRPHTGEILAMVSHPAYDPNQFARGISAAEWTAISNDPLFPLRNRALQGEYPPGSTFKIVVAAAGLEEGVIDSTTRFSCGGAYRFRGRSYRCWKRGGHGALTVHQALVQSCDVFFYQLGQRLGIETIAAYGRRFGLGSRTTIPLRENSGVMPDNAWKLQRFGERWYQGETLSVSIGQGYVLATPLQMAGIVAALASDGWRYRPRLVTRVEAPDGTVRRRYESEILDELGLSPGTLAQIRNALRDVVMSARGTGQRARVPGIDVAGKTGTSQVVRLSRDAQGEEEIPRHLRDHAWFVSYAPAGAPEIALAVLVEHAGEGGGRAAAPIAAEVLRAYFEVEEPAPDGVVEIRSASRDPL